MLLLLSFLACGPSGDAENGAVLYTQGCASCHGDDGTAGVDGASDLTEEVPEASDEELADVILNGSGDMSAVYSDEQDALDIVAYLRETF